MSSDTTIAKPAPAVSAQALGIFLALLGAALFATKGIIIKLALADGIDTLTTLAWRQVVAVPVFVTVGVLGYRRRLREAPAGAAPVLDIKTLFQALGVGVLGYYVASLLDFSGLAYITAQLDRLILLTYPFFVVAFGVLFFRRRITPLMIVSLLVSYAGIIIIFARDFSVEGDNVVLGALLVFGSALAYAGYQVLAKPLIDKLGAQLFTS
ncbi:MAG TPA: EamA family transporter, partial [Devosia sp.]|nr:EamA family transporter [Devosia sp.]